MLLEKYCLRVILSFKNTFFLINFSVRLKKSCFWNYLCLGGFLIYKYKNIIHVDIFEENLSNDLIINLKKTFILPLKNLSLPGELLLRGPSSRLIDWTLFFLGDISDFTGLVNPEFTKSLDSGLKSRTLVSLISSLHGEARKAY